MNKPNREIEHCTQTDMAPGHILGERLRRCTPAKETGEKLTQKEKKIPKDGRKHDRIEEKSKKSTHKGNAVMRQKKNETANETFERERNHKHRAQTVGKLRTIEEYRFLVTRKQLTTVCAVKKSAYVPYTRHCSVINAIA